MHVEMGQGTRAYVSLKGAYQGRGNIDARCDLVMDISRMTQKYKNIGAV